MFQYFPIQGDSMQTGVYFVAWIIFTDVFFLAFDEQKHYI